MHRVGCWELGEGFEEEEEKVKSLPPRPPPPPRVGKKTDFLRLNPRGVFGVIINNYQ